MFRTSSTVLSQFNFGSKKFLANTTISADQMEVGVVIKPLDGYCALMINYLSFAIENQIQDSTVDATLDYIIKN
jgi:hypothetical protein